MLDEKWAADATYFRGLYINLVKQEFARFEFTEDLAEASVLPRHIAEPETLSARNTISQILRTATVGRLLVC